MTLPYWTLVSDSLPPTGIFKIMMFLDIVLTSGHGILIFTVFILDIEDLFNAIKKLVLTIRQKIEGIREEIKEKERKRSATGQFVQMMARQNNLITKSMYK